MPCRIRYISTSKSSLQFFFTRSAHLPSFFLLCLLSSKIALRFNLWSHEKIKTSTSAALAPPLMLSCQLSCSCAKTLRLRWQYMISVNFSSISQTSLGKCSVLVVWNLYIRKRKKNPCFFREFPLISSLLMDHSVSPLWLRIYIVHGHTLY